jgi:hypothetical protein
MVAQNTRADTVIAFWDFNSAFDVTDETVQIVHSASIGGGTIYQQRADTDGNGKTGVAFADPSLGINAAEGRSFAWNDVSKDGNNDAEFFAEFSTAGFANIKFRFDVRGNSDGQIISYDLKYDLNPLEDVDFSGGTIKDFAGGNSNPIFNNQPLSNNSSDYVSESVDLSGFTAMNNQSYVAIRLDDFKNNDAMRIDNFLVTGVTAIPEPASAVFLFVVGGLSAVRRRRR